MALEKKRGAQARKDRLWVFTNESIKHHNTMTKEEPTWEEAIEAMSDIYKRFVYESRDGSIRRELNTSRWGQLSQHEMACLRKLIPHNMQLMLQLGDKTL